MRTRLATTALATAICALVLTGCGGSSDDDSNSSKSSSGSSKSKTTSAGDEVSADLHVHLTNIGSKKATGGVPVPTGIQCSMSIPAICNATVTCPAADAKDGSREQAACAWLATDEARETLLKEPPANQACTMQYGGPETAVVTGTLGDDDVDVTLSRQDGCAIARFDASSVLWNEPEGELKADMSRPDEVEDPPAAFDK